MNVQDFFHRRKFRVWPFFHAGYGRFGHSLYLLYIEYIKRKYIDVIIIYRSTECLPSEASVAFYEAGILRISSLVRYLLSVTCRSLLSTSNLQLQTGISHAMP